MPHDITQAYWDLVLEKGRANGLNEVSDLRPDMDMDDHRPPHSYAFMQEDQRKLRSAQMLRSLGSRNGFTKASIEVVRIHY